MNRTEYNTIHQWNLRHWVKTGVCSFCNSVSKTEWSNRSGKYIKGDRSDWQELCRSCHQEYDNKILPDIIEIQSAANRIITYPWFKGF